LRRYPIRLIMLVILVLAGYANGEQGGQWLPETTLPEAKRVEFAGNTFDVYILDIRVTPVKLFWKDDLGQLFKSFQRVNDWVVRQGQTLSFAMNAGIFNADNVPLGLQVQEGNELTPLNLQDGDGNFYLKPNGVFFINANGAHIVESPAYPNVAGVVHLAVQSGPLLVHQNTLHPSFQATSPNVFTRNGVGLRNAFTAIFAISNEPVNLYTFARFFKEALQCPEALYLDGAISAMYAPALGRTTLEGNFAGILGVTQPSASPENVPQE
jgi:uncharacterized protein YigE (DUF2233 family)